MRVRPTLSAALSLIVATAVAAPAHAETHAARFQQTCHGVPEKLVPPTDNLGQVVIINTTSEPQVHVGDTVTATVQFVPNPAPVAKLPLGAKITHQSRIKIDLDLPEGFDVTGVRTSGNSNLTGMTAFTVNAAGAKDPKGRILRLASADNATVGNSPNVSSSQEAPADLPVSGNSVTWVEPTVTLTMTATSPGTGTLSVRLKGGADAPGANPKAYMTSLLKTDAPLVGAIFANIYCTPRNTSSAPINAPARNLFTWTVQPAAAPSTPVPAPTTAPTAPETTPSAAPVVTIAPVSAAAGEHTTVHVDVADKDVTGAVAVTVGDTTTTVPLAGGSAEAEVTFDSPGEHTVEAVFTPTGGAPTQPVTQTVTVAAAPESTTTTADDSTTTPAATTSTAASAAASTSPTTATGTAAPAADSSGGVWWWLLGVGALALAGVAALVVARSRRTTGQHAS